MQNLASLIDHTLLKPDATAREIEQLCNEAATHRFYSVCLNPCWLELAAVRLAGTGVRLCTVAGFPLGASATQIKAGEAALAVEQGANEVDMVLNIGALKSGDPRRAEADVNEVVRALKGKALLKVILETCLLSDSEIVLACQLCEAAGADFVKTSTGFSRAGATVEAVRLMRQTVGDRLGVKASGGIRDRMAAMAMVEAGASRLGTSASLVIIEAG